MPCLLIRFVQKGLRVVGRQKGSLLRESSFLAEQFRQAQNSNTNLRAGEDLGFELFALLDLAGVAVNQESLGSTQLGQHGLGQKVKDDKLKPER